MKNKLKEYIELTTIQKKELWDKAIFVFDTNVLFNLYRYSQKTSEALIECIKSFKERVYLPYQVAKEFMEKRYDVIYEINDRKEKIENAKKEFLDKVALVFRFEKKDNSYVMFETSITAAVEKMLNENYQVISYKEDKILTDILSIYDGKTGDDFSKTDLEKYTREGKIRYENKIAPGYKDSNKNDNKYGDYFIWIQLMDYAKENDKNIIFVTDDRKEDWWYIKHNKIVSPRYELIKEFNETTKKSFYMYNIDNFIKIYNKNNQSVIEKEIINEIKSISEENEYTNKFIDEFLQKQGNKRIKYILDEKIKKDNMYKGIINRLIEESNKEETKNKFKSDIEHVQVKLEQNNNELEELKKYFLSKFMEEKYDSNK